MRNANKDKWINTYMRDQQMRDKLKTIDIYPSINHNDNMVDLGEQGNNTSVQDICFFTKAF